MIRSRHLTLIDIAALAPPPDNREGPECLGNQEKGPQVIKPKPGNVRHAVFEAKCGHDGQSDLFPFEWPFRDDNLDIDDIHAAMESKSIPGWRPLPNTRRDGRARR